MYNMDTFIDKCLRGEVLSGEIHDYIESWHEKTDCDLELYAYLGMTQKEYALFVEDEKNLGAILYSRKHSVDLNSIFQKDHRMAARSSSVDKEEEIGEWLSSMGID